MSSQLGAGRWLFVPVCITNKPFVPIFFGGGGGGEKGMQLLSGSTCNIQGDGSVADETLEKQTFFFYAVP